MNTNTNTNVITATEQLAIKIAQDHIDLLEADKRTRIDAAKAMACSVGTTNPTVPSVAYDAYKC